MRLPDHSPRDLTDRVFRKTLENVDNLREFLEEALPDHIAALDCANARLLPREFVAPDWRGREADVLYEIPYQTQNGTRLALVCVLIEHQSRTDVLMPFRTLLLMVSFWDRQWREWQQLPVPRPQLRLTPVIPIVLYTGAAPWGSTRRMTELLDEPQVFHAFAPDVEPLFWNLAEHTPDELLNQGDGWRNLLAVVRQELADEADFHRVFREATRRLETLADRDRPRWQELLEAILTWAYARRPQKECAALQAAAATVQLDLRRRKEVLNMGQTIAESLIEEGMEKGQLRLARSLLLDILKKRFRKVPKAVKQRIETTTELSRLRETILEAMNLESLDDLHL
jgi:hypothetical protein